MIRPVVLEQEKRRRENATTYEGFSSGSVLKSLRSPAFDRGSNISWIGPFVSGRQSRSFVGNQYKGAIFGGNERLSAVQALGEQVLASVIESPKRFRNTPALDVHQKNSAASASRSRGYAACHSKSDRDAAGVTPHRWSTVLVSAD